MTALAFLNATLSSCGGTQYGLPAARIDSCSLQLQVKICAHTSLCVEAAASRGKAWRLLLLLLSLLLPLTDVCQPAQESPVCAASPPGSRDTSSATGAPHGESMCKRSSTL